jgi:leucyl/phenylalanyl-tRNA--protein transferase
MEAAASQPRDGSKAKGIALKAKSVALRVKSIAKNVVRRSTLIMLRNLFQVVDPVNVGDWAALSVRHPGLTNGSTRSVWSFVTPTAADVVANYVRGLVLFGRTGSYGAYFEWASYPNRAVITPQTAKIPKRLRPILRRGELEVRYDQDFEAIVRSCQQGRDGWLTAELIDVYRKVHRLGFVATVGAYRDGKLVGGIWGLGAGRVFGIMSMFHSESNAGAIALAALSQTVSTNGRWSVIDCGLLNPNFERYGATEISRSQFSELVLQNLT